MEVMVSVSIFAIIVTVGIVALVSINDAYRKSEASRQTIDSLTYILESMSRRIRTAQTWTLGNNGGSLTILDQDNITVTYAWDVTDKEITIAILNPSPITCTPQPSCQIPNVADSSTQPGGVYNLTPTDVFIATTQPDGITPVPGGGLTFQLFGGKADHTQEYLQVNLGGYSNDGKQISNFTFQTGISKRILDQ